MAESIVAGDFKKGITVQIDGKVCKIIDFQHVKPGKGAAFVRTKYKNIMGGGVVETAFKPTDKFEKAIIERKDMQYLYKDGDLYYFMDMETYDQIPIGADVIEDSLKFVKENEICNVSSHQGTVFDVKAPDFVELLVTECEPGVKGDTATGATKPCTVETGAQVMVPLFVNEGDTIRIDTRTSEYMSRV